MYMYKREIYDKIFVCLIMFSLKYQTWNKLLRRSNTWAGRGSKVRTLANFIFQALQKEADLL